MKEKLTEEQIKEKYGDVFKITSDKFTAYLRKPDRYLIGNFMSKVNVNMVVACEELYKACVIDEISDKEILGNDDIFMGTMEHIQELVIIKKSVLKKL